MKMSISLCLPTHYRSDQLPDCLNALIPQLKKGDEILIGITNGDEKTNQVARHFLPLFNCTSQIVVVNEASLIYKLNALAFASSNDWIVTTDDDSIPHFDWLLRLREGISEVGVGALGGRDINDGIDSVNSKIGLVSWSGRLHGNHEKVSYKKKNVHFLKGVNFAIRKECFPISDKMIMYGAEPHSEIYLCRNAKRKGYYVKYDPEILVNHYPGVRYELNREKSSALSYLYNRNLVLAFGLNGEYLTLARIIAYQLFLGRSPSYGILRALWSLNDAPNSINIWLNAIRGLFDGVRVILRKNEK